MVLLFTRRVVLAWLLCAFSFALTTIINVYIDVNKSLLRSYLPTLVPVEVEELKAREWFRFLLSGVEFLHKRGVVHNDIK
jgi:serine/threonine protein kinase